MDGEANLRVLLVEDESVVALDIERQLRGLGYEIVGSVDNGPDAIRLSREQSPDLVLMDIRLKGDMDGIDAASAILGDLDIPVIFVSAYSDEQSVIRAKKSTPYGYVLKPFQERELAIAIELAIYKHRTERELASGRELLTRTVAAISDAVVTTDADGGIRFFNPAAERLAGLSDGDQGADFARRIPIESVPTEGRTELELHRPDGSVVPVDVASSDLGFGAGRVHVIRDMSLARAAKNRLIQAKRHAEEAARSKSEFLARVSHELRTPLNSILGMTDLALERAEDEEQAEYLSVVKSSAQALNRLIGDILDFSRIDSGSIEIEEVDFTLSELLEESVGQAFREAEKKSLPMYLYLDPSCCRVVRSDRRLIRQVLAALLANAVKFTDEGEVSVEALCYRDGAGHAEITLSVRDTGTGIPADLTDEVFKPFAQGDAVMTRTYGGSGIGLAMVDRIVSALGGSCDVKSVEGEGSAFIIRLPVVTSEAASGTSAGTDRSRPPAGPVTIVSDSATFDRFLRMYASSLGLDVDEGTKDDESTGGASPTVILDGQAGNASMLRKKHGTTAVVVDGPVSIAGFASLLSEVDGSVSRVDESEPVQLAGKTALVVEDNRINRLLVVRLLQKVGCRTIEAGSGDEALATLQREPVDFVLLDIEMPGINGYETARRIRSGAYGDPNVVILSVSGHDVQAESGRMAEAGIDGQLTKPFKLEELSVLLSSGNRSGAPRIVERDDVLSQYIRDARIALASLDCERLVALSKGSRPRLAEAGLTHAAELVFRVQLASRKNDCPQVERLLREMDTSRTAAGIKADNQYNE